MSKRIHVVVGLLINSSGEICISKRPEGKHLGGFWEFPGGKVELNESPFDALKREILEELELTIEAADSFMEISFDYPEKMVFLDVFRSYRFYGESLQKQGVGKEGQEFRWVKISDLSSYKFPEANEPIVLKLIEGANS